jgi:hypothetical protein
MKLKDWKPRKNQQDENKKAAGDGAPNKKEESALAFDAGGVYIGLPMTSDPVPKVTVSTAGRPGSSGSGSEDCTSVSSLRLNTKNDLLTSDSNRSLTSALPYDGEEDGVSQAGSVGLTEFAASEDQSLAEFNLGGVLEDHEDDDESFDDSALSLRDATTSTTSISSSAIPPPGGTPLSYAYHSRPSSQSPFDIDKGISESAYYVGLYTTTKSRTGSRNSPSLVSTAQLNSSTQAATDSGNSSGSSTNFHEEPTIEEVTQAQRLRKAYSNQNDEDIAEVEEEEEGEDEGAVRGDREEVEEVDGEGHYSDAGHNVLSLVKNSSPASSVSALQDYHSFQHEGVSHV